MTDWSVRLVVASTAPPADEQTEALYQNLDAYSPAIGMTRHGTLEFQLAVTAAALLDATTTANQAVQDACASAGLLDTAIVEMEALTWDEFDRRLDLPQVPELWSVSEAAEHLGVTNQRINQLVHAYPKALPAVVKLAGDRGPRLWLADTWRRFAKTGRQSGRPRSAAATSKDSAVTG
jgi:hypothetical protein